MSLIKIALSPLSVLAPITGGMTVLGSVAANSGNPAKYFFTKDKGLFGIRRKIQKLGLSTFSNSINEIRAGKVADSTKGIS